MSTLLSPPLSAQRSGPSTGDWVVLAYVPSKRGAVRAVPVMDPAKPFLMQGYETVDAALHGALDSSAARQGGGLLLNVRTGKSRAFGPLKREAKPQHTV